jgi:hypothetical protein
VSEIARLLKPNGVAYASFFLYGSGGEADRSNRHPLEFSVTHDDYAVSLEDFPANAVAFDEAFVCRSLHRAGLRLLGRPRYGSQDLLLIARENNGEYPHLLSGWHELEKERWRWTERVFAVRLAQRPEKATTLRFRFMIARALLEETGIVRLQASVNDVALQASEFTTAGEHTYLQDIPRGALHGSESPFIRFELEKTFTSGRDERELGLQVLFWTPCNDARRALNAIEIV